MYCERVTVGGREREIVPLQYTGKRVLLDFEGFPMEKRDRLGVQNMLTQVGFPTFERFLSIDFSGVPAF